MNEQKIVLPGGAGLVGQNLVAQLVAKGHTRIVVIDKHRPNVEVLQRIHAGVHCEVADLARPGAWQRHFEDAGAVVMLQAQIGGNDYEDFVRNNVDSTRLILETMRTHKVPYLVHISSSVVQSVADDFYSRTKREQERIVLESGFDCPILRPTLMFGWFDRKHLGWLSRFMKKVPVFPIPGHGRYVRQPLYARDFCRIIVSCIENRIGRGIYNISGREKIHYIDMIRQIRHATGARTFIVRIPFWLFLSLLSTWALFDRNPPFTTQQLRALCANDEFEVIDWPRIFNVSSTPFARALDETFQDARYGGVVLQF
jgi:uncharacterized protein YbjT (DUF2867 family)